MENDDFEIKTKYKVGQKEFESYEEAEEYKRKQLKNDLLIDELEDYMFEIKSQLEDNMNPVFLNGKSADYLSDIEINQFRDALYDFMVLRRKYMGVIEYISPNKEENNKIQSPIYYRGKKYYPTRKEAEKNRMRGDRIYYAANLGYYLVRPKKRSFWG